MVVLILDLQLTSGSDRGCARDAAANALPSGVVLTPKNRFVLT